MKAQENTAALSSGYTDTIQNYGLRKSVLYPNATHCVWVYNVFLFAELQDILSAFRDSRVEVIVLKGAALAETVYAHIGLRPMCDIDLLIKPETMEAAGTVLVRLGYRPAPNNPAAYIKADTLPVMVDVHTALAHLNSNEMARAWRESKDTVVAGVPARILSCEDTLVHIISHMSFSHGFVLEKWLCDIDRVARHYQREIEWKAVIARLEHCRLIAPARYIFAKAAREFDTPIAPWVHAELKSKNKNLVHAFLFRLLLSQKKPVRYLDYLLPVLITEGFFNKAKLIRRWLFPPKNIIKNRFGISNSILILLCYAARILILTAKACVGVIVLLKRAFLEVYQSITRPGTLR